MKKTIVPILTAALALSGSFVSAQSTWNGANGTLWNDAANWSVLPTPGNSIASQLIFAGSTNTNTSNDFAVDSRFNGITFNSTASAFTLSGNRITLGGNIGFDANPGSAVTHTINLDILLNAGRTINTRGNGAISISGNITGDYNFTKGTQAGLLTLTGPSSTFDQMLIDNGEVQFTSMANTGTASSIGDGTQIRVGGGNNTATLTYIGSSNVSTNRTLLIGDNTANLTGGSIIKNNSTTGTMSFTGSMAPLANNNQNRNLQLAGNNTGNNVMGIDLINFSGGGNLSLTKAEAGKWVLSGNNTYSGNTSVSNGTLAITGNNSGNGPISVTSTGTFQIGNGGTTGQVNSASPISVAGASSTLAFNRTNDITISNAITVSSTGDLRLGAADSTAIQTGNVTLSNLIAVSGFDIRAEAGDARRLEFSGLDLVGATSRVVTIADAFDGALRFSTNSMNGTARIIFDVTGGLQAPTLEINTSTLTVNRVDLTNTNGQLMNIHAVGGARVLDSTSGSTLYLSTNSTSTGIAFGGGNNLTITNSSGNAFNFNSNVISNYTFRQDNSATTTLNGTVSLSTSSSAGIGNLTISGSGAGDMVFNGAISSGNATGTAVSINRAVGSVTAFNAAGTNAGTTFIQQGIARVGNNTAFGTGAVELANTDAVLELANGVSMANALTVRNTGDLKTLRLQSGATAASYNGSINIVEAGAGNFVVSADASGTLTLGGIITSGNVTRGITKTGLGTVVLTGNNTTYLGNTTVSAGTLLVNNTSGTGAGNVTVSSGAILGGYGSISGSANVTGVLAPGNSIESLGIDGDLSFLTATSKYEYELNSATLGGDLTHSVNNLNIDDKLTTLTLTELFSGTLNVDDKLTLISYSGTWNLGLFAYADGDDGFLSDGEEFTLGSNTWVFDYNDTTAGSNFTGDLGDATKYVTMTVVPEPRAALLGSLGLLALLRRRRK